MIWFSTLRSFENMSSEISALLQTQSIKFFLTGNNTFLEFCLEVLGNNTNTQKNIFRPHTIFGTTLVFSQIA